MKNSILIKKADELAHLVHKHTKKFPNEELFGLTSQIRRAAVSIPLNIIEGFARQSDKDFKRFLLISFGSLKEVKYLLNFAFKEKYIDKEDYEETIKISDEIGKIIWTLIKKLEVKL